MKGMLYKDFFVLRKQFGWYLIILGSYGTLGALGTLPLDTTMGTATILLVLLASLTSVSTDDLARWSPFAAATPGGRANIVHSKYVLTLIAAAVGIVMNILIVLLVTLLGKAGQELPALLLSAPACGMAALLLGAVTLPLMLKYGVEKARVLLGVVAGVLTAAIIAAQTILSSALETGEGLPTGGVPAAVAAVAVVAGGYALSWRVSLGILARREF